MGARCQVCERGTLHAFGVCSGIEYLQCSLCQSICADEGAFNSANKGGSREYNEEYWSFEVRAARGRSYGSSILRAAEVFRMARVEVNRFLDISGGDGSLLDALSTLLPEMSEVFHVIEPFPPPPAFRSQHPNYKVGFIEDVEGQFDGGTCIEVIEHLFPETLKSLVRALSSRASPGALFYFNSAQPSFVIERDPAYLDPLVRGHVASYSVQGLQVLFRRFGFTVHELPGRDWGFLAEFTSAPPETLDGMFARLWSPQPENVQRIEACKFGPMFLAAGLESARCYLEAANGEARTRWALSLERRLTAAS